MANIDYIIPISNTELVRSQIAAILTDELSNQRALIEALTDPLTEDQQLLLDSMPEMVFEERFHRPGTEEASLINVWLDNAPISELTGTERQTDITKFNIEYYSRSKGSVHSYGDKKSALKAHRCLMACREVLMSPYYVTLGFAPGMIGSRTAQNLQIFQPDNGVDSNNTVNGLLSLHVKILETQSKIEGVPLLINNTIHRLYDTDKGYYYEINNT